MTVLDGPTPLPPARRAEAAALLGRAFGSDPMMRYVLPDEARRARLLPHLLGGLLRHSLAHGRADAAPDLAGVACWLSPGNTAPTVPQMLRSGLLAGTLRLGPAGVRRLFRLVGPMEDTHKRLMPGPHWYLQLLAVEPDRAGRGTGGALLVAGLARADADRLPCYLETHNERNLRFYGRHGFEVVDETDVPGAIRYWGMRWEPGGLAGVTANVPPRPMGDGAQATADLRNGG